MTAEPVQGLLMFACIAGLSSLFGAMCYPLVTYGLPAFLFSVLSIVCVAVAWRGSAPVGFSVINYVLAVMSVIISIFGMISGAYAMMVAISF